MALLDIFNASDIKKENAELKDLLQKIGATEFIEVQKRIDLLKTQELGYLNDIDKLKQELNQERRRNSEELKKLNFDLIENQKKTSNELKKIELELNEKQKQIISIEEDLMFESFALYTPHFSFQTSEDYKLRLDEMRKHQKNMIKQGVAATGNQNWTVNGSAADGKKMVKDMIKLVLRSFNNECDYCVDNVKFNNIDSHVKRIVTSFEALNKLGQLMQVSISGDYYNLKMSELHLAYEYQQKKQEEKEEQRRLKEEMREQEKLEREIKIARDRILKEKKHFSQAIEEIKSRIEKSKNDIERQDLNLKLNELQSQSSSLEQEEKQIDYREQNAKAGYVYVISNLGSFGENIFKIGMTRRLEPLDRIYELGDASVPFPFDVHALIFSDNAPELEAKIQNQFHQGRLNKINNRKEFFKADINELEKTIKQNYNKIVDFEKVPGAEQYRESLLIKD